MNAKLLFKNCTVHMKYSALFIIYYLFIIYSYHTIFLNLEYEASYHITRYA